MRSIALFGLVGQMGVAGGGERKSKGPASIVLQKKTLTPFIYAIVPKANKPKQKIEWLTIFRWREWKRRWSIVEGAKISDYIILAIQHMHQHQ